MNTEKNEISSSLVDYAKEKIVELVGELDADIVANSDITCQKSKYGVTISIVVSDLNDTNKSDTIYLISTYNNSFTRVCFNKVDVDEVIDYAKAFMLLK